MKTIESVTALVNCLFSVYNQSIQGLDWEEKITEYADVINEFISYDTDLNELYMQIRQNFANLPQPSAIKKMLSKNHKRAEVKEYQQDPNNGKKIVVTCTRNGIIRECREYIVDNVESSKAFSDITDKIKENFDSYEVYYYKADTTIFHGCRQLEDGTIQATAEAWIPQGYNEKGEVIGYEKRKIA